MPELPTKHVLLISYLFPPVGGSGVQRNLKYVKYLREFGWEPIVLTVKPINYHIYDYSLLEELPEGIEIIRTESLDPLRLTSFAFSKKVPTSREHGNPSQVSANPRFKEGSPSLRAYRWLRGFAAIPDVQLAWIPFAVKAGINATKRHKIDVILASIGPHSSALVGKLISRKTQIPYVLDFRDGWIDYQHLPRPTAIHRWAHERLERSCLTNASETIVYGDYLATKLSGRYPHLADRLSVITNGFDPDDMRRAIPVDKPNKCRIVYSGALFDTYEPHFRAMLEALSIVPDCVRQQLEIVFVGQAYDRAEQQVRDAELQDHVRLLGYRSHAEALGYLASADAALLFIPQGDVSSLSGKIFEYFMARKPIIACVEQDGACAELLRRTNQSQWVVGPTDAHRLKDAFIELTSTGFATPDLCAVAEYSRKTQTKKLASILDRATR